MLKKIIIVVAVIIAGLVTGYYSQPIYNLVWPGGSTKTLGFANDKRVPGTENGGVTQKAPQYISEGDAISAVKDLPLMNKLSELEGTKLVFAADQQPTDDYPVWTVEVKQRHTDKVPATMYFQVDALSGKVLELQKDDMKISGIGLLMTKKEVKKIQGRAPKSRSVFDRTLRQNVRIDSYAGLEILFDSRSKVIRVTVTNADYLGPRGIKVGDSKKDIIRLFGKAHTAPTNLLIYSPVDDDGMNFTVKLDDSGQAVEISMETVTR